MIVTEETKAVAQHIDDYFLAHPERHEQQDWLTLDGNSAHDKVQNINESNVCDTTMCIAGSAVFLTRPLSEYRAFIRGAESWEEEGARLLGLDYDEADWLFYNTGNETAISAVRAIANGDVDKFEEIRFG